MRHAPLEFEMGQRGRARRETLNLTVTALAKRMNVSLTRVCQLERDGASTVDVIRRWAKALDMTPGELAFGAEPR